MPKRQSPVAKPKLEKPPPPPPSTWRVTLAGDAPPLDVLATSAVISTAGELAFKGGLMAASSGARWPPANGAARGADRRRRPMIWRTKVGHPVARMGGLDPHAVLFEPFDSGDARPCTVIQIPQGYRQRDPAWPRDIAQWVRAQG